MKSRLKATLAAAAAAASLALAACSSSAAGHTASTGTSGSAGASGGSSGGAKTINLLWVQPLFTHPVHKIMQAGFNAGCQKYHYTCTLVGNPSATNYDIPGTIALAQAAMAKTKFDAIAVYDADPGIDSFIATLAKEGYPVVTWHVIPPEGSVTGLKAAAAEDIPTAGKNAADSIGAKIGGTGTVAVSEGSSNTTENLMASSFTAEMKAKYPNVKVLKPILEGFDPSAAQAKAVGEIQADSSIVAAFSTTGGGAETWSGAERTTGKTITIIGMDYTRQNLDLVKAGSVYGLVAQPLYPEGEKAAELAGALAQGQSVSYANVMPSPVIGSADLGTYYDILTKAGD